MNDEFNSGAAMEVFREVTLAQCDVILETIDGIDEWEASATDEWEAAVGTDLQEKWIDDAGANGLEDAEGYLQMYQDELAAFDESEVEDPSLTCAGRS